MAPKRSEGTTQQSNELAVQLQPDQSRPGKIGASNPTLRRARKELCVGRVCSAKPAMIGGCLEVNCDGQRRVPRPQFVRKAAASGTLESFPFFNISSSLPHYHP